MQYTVSIYIMRIVLHEGKGDRATHMQTMRVRDREKGVHLIMSHILSHLKKCTAGKKYLKLP